MFTAVTTAENIPGFSVVMLNRVRRDPSLSLVDNAFTTPSGHEGVTFVAPTGDSGTSGWSPLSREMWSR